MLSPICYFEFQTKMDLLISTVGDSTQLAISMPDQFELITTKY